MAPPIPDRWTAYKACGMIIEGTKFICFKVPLRKNIQLNNKEITEIWDIPTLLSRIPNLGAVIDLTNTSRYYNPSEFQDAGVQYKKIFIPGRVIPPNSIIKQFMDTVDILLEEIGESLIGVHCTHGLNRTGFMLCRYMKDRMGIPGNVAIKKFEKARGYQIERENYIADILGKKPPPPEFGPDTKVKPLKEEKSKENKRKSKKIKRSIESKISKESKRSKEEKPIENWRARSESDGDAGYSRNFSSFNKSNRNDKKMQDRSTNFKFDYKYDY